MEKIINYPYTFKLAGETIELNKSMMRKITVQGIEQKVSFDGNVIGVSYSEDANDYVIVISYPVGLYIITKKFGWMGPFESAEEVTYKMDDGGIPQLKGTKSGKPGIFPL